MATCNKEDEIRFFTFFHFSSKWNIEKAIWNVRTPILPSLYQVSKPVRLYIGRPPISSFLACQLIHPVDLPHCPLILLSLYQVSQLATFLHPVDLSHFHLYVKFCRLVVCIRWCEQTSLHQVTVNWGLFSQIVITPIMRRHLFDHHLIKCHHNLRMAGN